MPVMSYLAYPTPGNKQVLYQELVRLHPCEVLPADNQELLILITDTDSINAETELQSQLKQIPSLGGLALVSAFEDSAIVKGHSTT